MTPRKYTASKRKQILTHYKNGVTKPAEIRKLTGANLTYIYEVIKKYKAGKYAKEGTQKGEPKPETPTPTTEGAPEKAKIEFEFQPVTPPPEIAALKPSVTVEGELAAAGEAAKEDTLTQEMITHLFTSVNDLIPQKYKRPKESMELLGSVWYKPLNRLFAKYVDENIDLYFAIITTIIVFAPCAVEYVGDKRKEQKKGLPPTKAQKAATEGLPQIE